MLAAKLERAPDGCDVWSEGSCAIGWGHFTILPEICTECDQLSLGEIILSADIRLDNRDELGQLLGIPPDAIKNICDACLLLRAYERWKEDCLSYLLGEFAFVLWDKSQSRLFAARDPLGDRGLCYMLNDRVCLVASEISNLLAHPDVVPQINENYIAVYLTGLGEDPKETLYRNIYYLPAAHGLSVGENDVRIWSYWSIDPNYIICYQKEQDYAEHYLDLLKKAIQCRMRCIGDIGVSLSGGLDSSAIAALAATLMASNEKIPQPLKSFSYAFDELVECDERSYIRPLVKEYDIQPQFLLCDDKWPLKDLDDWSTSRDYILTDPYALLPASVRSAAEVAGVKLLLVGYYGDSLFGGGAYWVLDMLLHGRLLDIIKTTGSHAATIDWRDTFFDHGLRRLIPSSLRHGYRRFIPRRPEKFVAAINKQFIRRTNIAEFMAQPTGGEGWRPGLWERYKGLTPDALGQGYSVVRYQYNRHHLDAVHPYYDRRLVEFVMAVPAYILGGPDYDRRVHRLAMKGILPEEIRLRRDRTTFVTLALKGLQIHEWSKVRNLLSSPQVVERGYVDPSWLCNRLDTGFDLSPDSLLLWRILCLELWLQRYWS